MAFSVLYLLFEVLTFWQRRLWRLLRRRSRTTVLREQLAASRSYEDWNERAFELDAALGNDVWRQNPISRKYDYRLIMDRLQCLIDARESNDIPALIQLLRGGVLRNYGNISNLNLFNHAFAGTKLLIEDYISTTIDALIQLASDASLSRSSKIDLLHGTKQSFGTTSLVLQGGAIFGLYHLGVVRALRKANCLPRNITGTAVGALIAALVAIKNDDELDDIGANLDLTAFTNLAKGSSKRRAKRLLEKGYLLDVTVLEACVKANVGDITFEEAFHRTRRVLNITVFSHKNKSPILLNYLTSPNALIWSAACASNATVGLYEHTQILAKDENGDIVPYTSEDVRWTHWSEARMSEKDSPYARISMLFNVNHFIVSQARPYLAPFLSSDLHRHRRRGAWLVFVRLLGFEIRHRLSQLDLLGLLPVFIRRFLIDDHIQGATVTIVPNLCLADFEQLLAAPSKSSVDYWALKGEQSVWPALALIQARIGIEIVLDELYEAVRKISRDENEVREKPVLRGRTRSMDAAAL